METPDVPMTPNGMVPQATFDRLVNTIAEELQVQIDVHRLEDPNGVRETAELIADMVIRRFEISARSRPD
jgi:hypothetical protein